MVRAALDARQRRQKIYRCSLAGVRSGEALTKAGRVQLITNNSLSLSTDVKSNVRGATFIPGLHNVSSAQNPS